MELTQHYADVRPVETYAGRRVFIVGQAELGFRAGYRPAAMGSPDRPRVAVAGAHVRGNAIPGRRPRPLRPAVRGPRPWRRRQRPRRGDRPRRARSGAELVVHLRRTDGGADMVVEADDVIAATGFVTPLVDLPALGVATFGASQLPAQTPWWESVSVPGIFFAGTIGQGSKGLRKHGIPANSGAVHGARYNARVLAGHLARTRFGIEPDRPTIAPDAVAGLPGGRTGRVARTLPPARLPRPGAHRRRLRRPARRRRRSRWPTCSMRVGPTRSSPPSRRTAAGRSIPVIYSRLGGQVVERAIDPDPLLRYDTTDTRLAIADLASRVAAG